VNKYYIAENMKPIDLISFNSYTSYAGVGISCVNFQSPFGTANYLPVVEVTNQLPFSFPIAMPLKFH
jgi:hypothetical protein